MIGTVSRLKHLCPGGMFKVFTVLASAVMLYQFACKFIALSSPAISTSVDTDIHPAAKAVKEKPERPVWFDDIQSATRGVSDTIRLLQQFISNTPSNRVSATNKNWFSRLCSDDT